MKADGFPDTGDFGQRPTYTPSSSGQSKSPEEEFYTQFKRKQTIFDRAYSMSSLGKLFWSINVIALTVIAFALASAKLSQADNQVIFDEKTGQVRITDRHGRVNIIKDGV